MKEKGILLIVSGPSGAGKGTVVEDIIKDGSCSLSISATTRTPRPYEIEGKHYFFKKKEEFEKMIKSNELLEHACFCENYYGTPRKYVEEQIEKGINVVLEIEVQGALQVKEKYSDAVLVFLIPPSLAELKNRLVGRGTEDTQTIEKRVNRAVEELEFLPQYNYVVVNDKVENAVSKIMAIAVAERMRVLRNFEIVGTFKGEI